MQGASNINNTQLDTSGKIDEKIAENKFNYYVSTISTEEPTEDKPELIFLENPSNTFTLKELINNSYTNLNAPVSSTVLVQDISKVYTLISYDNSNQVWTLNSNFDPAETLELTNTNKSLITSGPVDINGTLTLDKVKVNGKNQNYHMIT